MTENSRYYYTSGNAARKIAPQREYERAPKRRTQPQTQTRLKKRADRALAFNFGYTVFVVAAVMIMVGACAMMLNMQMGIDKQKSNLVSLERQIEEIQTDNEAKRMRLENMYSIEDIRRIATSELGMVYAKKGQIIYYETADEDYVKQNMDVPEAK